MITIAKLNQRHVLISEIVYRLIHIYDITVTQHLDHMKILHDGKKCHVCPIFFPENIFQKKE